MIGTEGRFQPKYRVAGDSKKGGEENCFGSSPRRRRSVLAAVKVMALLLVFSGCRRVDDRQIQGYVEGEYVYVSSPVAGALSAMHVQRGAQVEMNDPLFVLDSAPEEASRDEAKWRLAQARANLEDVRKGKRPSEIASLEAQLRQAQAALALAETELSRQEDLVRTEATPAQDLDRARAARDEAREHVTQLAADLETARLASRSDQIAASQANVQALEAALAQAEWTLAQKSQSAPQAGLVFDTLYRQGEWVAAGYPVVVLLPPQNIKVRAFLPEPELSRVHLGDRVRVHRDETSEPLVGTVSFISPQAEYTPPVIYSREARSKLVFMVEIAFGPDTGASLHPGQPADVEFGI